MYVCMYVCIMLKRLVKTNIDHTGDNRDAEIREHHKWHNEDGGEGHGGERALHTEGVVRVHVLPIGPPRRVPLR